MAFALAAECQGARRVAASNPERVISARLTRAALDFSSTILRCSREEQRPMAINMLRCAMVSAEASASSVSRMGKGG